MCLAEKHRPVLRTSLKSSWVHPVQVGFFEIVALPLFTAYQELMPESRPMLDNVRANYKQWHQLNAV